MATGAAPNIGARMATASAQAAVQNPIFAQAFTKALFQQVAGSPEEASHPQYAQQMQFNNGLPMNVHQIQQNDNSIDVDPEEFERIQAVAKRLRFAYFVVSTFLTITALLSFLSLTVITSGFLAFYVLIFSCLMCCFEIGWSMVTKYIVQNFGFLYNSAGRLIFFVFVAVLSWSLGNIKISSISLTLIF